MPPRKSMPPQESMPSRRSGAPDSPQGESRLRRALEQDPRGRMPRMPLLRMPLIWMPLTWMPLTWRPLTWRPCSTSGRAALPLGLPIRLQLSAPVWGLSAPVWAQGLGLTGGGRRERAGALEPRRMVSTSEPRRPCAGACASPAARGVRSVRGRSAPRGRSASRGRATLRRLLDRRHRSPVLPARARSSPPASRLAHRPPN